jgi:DNA-binding GntR family transcriptional regulator
LETHAAVESNKTDAAYRRLRGAILGAELSPGAPLRPAALQAAYGMGWTPLREALSRLEAERLVTTQRNRGFFVAPVSLDELEDLTRARQALEGALLADALADGDQAWEAGLIVAHYRLDQGTLPGGTWSDAAISRWLDLHESFHLALLAGGRNAWLMHFYRQTMAQERRHHRVLMIMPLLREAGPGARADSPAVEALREAIAMDNHTELMQAALARDLPHAAALMARHVDYKLGVFVQARATAEAPAARRGPGRVRRQQSTG